VGQRSTGFHIRPGVPAKKKRDDRSRPPRSKTFRKIDAPTQLISNIARFHEQESRSMLPSLRTPRSYGCWHGG
jgi:hypothetical protein